MAILVSAGDYIRMKLKGKWNGVVETNNIFYFQVTTLASGDVESSLHNAAQGFWETIHAALLIITAQQQKYTEIVAESLDADANLINGESYFIPDAMSTGGDTGESLPPADAWTFKYVRPSSIYRHGFKRFPGVPETDNSNGLPSTGVVSSLTALGNLLGTPFHFWADVAGVSTDSGGLITPFLVQKVLNGDIVSPAVFYEPSAVVFDKIGHQDTRDIGRGV